MKKKFERSFNMKKFISGMLVGTAVTCAAMMGLAATVKKTIIDPIEEKENMIEANRKKAMRKRVTR
jgi:gas vesicle protein